MFNETSYLGFLSDACDQYLPQIYAIADQYGIDRGIALAQIKQESGCRPGVCSGAGACGIAQFMPTTAARFGITDRTNVDQSLQGWGQYMRYLLDRYNGDYAKALAGYNAGEGSVDRYGGVPPFKETKNYVASILRALGIGPSVASGEPSSDFQAPGDYFPTETLTDPVELFSGAPAWLPIAALAVGVYFLLR